MNTLIKGYLISFGILVGVLIVSSMAFGAPISTTVQNLYIMGLKSTPTIGLTIDSNGLVATGTLASGFTDAAISSSTNTLSVTTTTTKITITIPSNLGYFTNDSGFTTPSSTDLTLSRFLQVLNRSDVSNVSSSANITATQFQGNLQGTNVSSTNMDVTTRLKSANVSSTRLTASTGLDGGYVNTTNVSTTQLDATTRLTAANASTTQLDVSTRLTAANASTTQIDIVTRGTYKGTAISTSTGANPTASIGVAAVNGTANTFLRSDGAPALSSQFASSSVSVAIFDATTTSPYSFAKWRTSRAITLSEVSCDEKAAATTTLEVYKATALATTTNAGTVIASLTCGIGGNTTTSLSTTALAYKDFLIFNVTSTLGVPTMTTVNVFFSIN